MENKEEIVNKLFILLRSTRQFSDLSKLTYVKEGEKEKVQVFFNSYSSTPSKEINVSMDSGWGLINDIIKKIV